MPQSTRETAASDGTGPSTGEFARAVFEIDVAGLSSLTLQVKDDALAAPLMARTRTILWLALLTGLIFILLEVLAEPPRIAAPFYVKCVGISTIAAALAVLRGAWTIRHARVLSVFVIIAAYLLTALSGMVSPSREYDTTAVLFVVGALTSAVLLPWGFWPQAATVLVGAAVLGVAVVYADGALHLFPSDPAAAVIIGFVLSIAAAREVQRYRLALIHELAVRRRAQAETRVLNADLERRVAARTAELQAANQQLRALSARLQAVREDERTSLAREIHDELGQELTALKLGLDLLPKRLSGADTDSSDDSLQQQLTEMSDLAGRLIQSVRRIATELRPTVLDDLGLTAAIEAQAREFERRSGVRCTFECESHAVIADRLRATALFRIAQEALTNVTRHAAATTVRITLRADGDSMVLEVKDDGLGITDQALQDTNSLGLLGIRERARLLSGTVDVLGAPEHGTTVRVRIPQRESVA